MTPTVQPLWLRVTHWVNALAVLIMVASGWQIYDASPLFADIHFPAAMTLGGWLGGALLWHFAGMWLLAANFLVYLTLNVFSGNFARKFLPLSSGSLLSHADLTRYNLLQKAAYLVAIVDIALLVVSGLTIWKPVQFPLLREALGGYDTARLVHFLAMTVLVGFVVIHVVMAALVPRSLVLIVRGR